MPRPTISTPSAAAYHSLWSTLLEAHSLATKLVSKSLTKLAPLSTYEYDVLLTIERSPGRRIRLSALAASTVYTKSGITRILKRLESQDFVIREDCEEDRRGAYAVLTPAGSTALQDTWRLYAPLIVKTLSSALSETEAARAAKVLEKLTQELEAPQVKGITQR